MWESSRENSSQTLGYDHVENLQDETHENQADIFSIYV